MRFITVILSPLQSFMAMGAVSVLMRLWMLVCSQECISVFYNLVEKKIKRAWWCKNLIVSCKELQTPRFHCLWWELGVSRTKIMQWNYCDTQMLSQPISLTLLAAFPPGCQGIQLFLILLSCSSKCFLTPSAGSHFRSTIAMSDNGNPQSLREISKLRLNSSMSCWHPSLEGWIVIWKRMWPFSGCCFLTSEVSFGDNDLSVFAGRGRTKGRKGQQIGREGFTNVLCNRQAKSRSTILWLAGWLHEETLKSPCKIIM